jgi:hypothetical protein
MWLPSARNNLEAAMVAEIAMVEETAMAEETVMVEVTAMAVAIEATTAEIAEVVTSAVTIAAVRLSLLTKMTKMLRRETWVLSGERSRNLIDDCHIIYLVIERRSLSPIRANILRIVYVYWLNTTNRRRVT